ncbi:hypothetical protein JSY36_04305 [Bacillus sp. H-16]|uniref:hypothetical protein n=1 Tax=Alteribacter salitolerans TaxID=2912333 RepID=UPI0019638A5E|nr:hypothetical protein [Alteribacter salitolerans]MBM7094973.1 hypothetical protein [Alteribacter salitolerans]
MDFNIVVGNFKNYFQREYIKNQSNLIYTSETAIILGVIGELYNLFCELKVKALPIEKESLEYMCKYTLGDSQQARKLINLINIGFTKENIYLDE